MIKWTPEAEEWYHETLKYWINHNKSNVYSLKIIYEVEKMEMLLSENPYIGATVEGAELETRRVIVLNQFSIYCNVENDVIAVVSFWNNKHNPQKLDLYGGC